MVFYAPTNVNAPEHLRALVVRVGKQPPTVQEYHEALTEKIEELVRLAPQNEKNLLDEFVVGLEPESLSDRELAEKLANSNEVSGLVYKVELKKAKQSQEELEELFRQAVLSDLYEIL